MNSRSVVLAVAPVSRVTTSRPPANLAVLLAFSGIACVFCLFYIPLAFLLLLIFAILFLRITVCAYTITVHACLAALFATRCSSARAQPLQHARPPGANGVRVAC